MPNESKRLVEVRLLVIAIVDVSNDAYMDALRGRTATDVSVLTVVAEEVSSNLESVPYIESVYVTTQGGVP